MYGVIYPDVNIQQYNIYVSNDSGLYSAVPGYCSFIISDLGVNRAIHEKCVFVTGLEQMFKGKCKTGALLKGGALYSNFYRTSAALFASKRGYTFCLTFSSSRAPYLIHYLLL